MKYCQSCGKQLPDEAAFCDECGTRVGQFKNARPESRTSSATERRSAKKRGSFFGFLFKLLILGGIIAGGYYWVNENYPELFHKKPNINIPSVPSLISNNDDNNSSSSSNNSNSDIFGIIPDSDPSPSNNQTQGSQTQNNQTDFNVSFADFNFYEDVRYDGVPEGAVYLEGGYANGDWKYELLIQYDTADGYFYDEIGKAFVDVEGESMKIELYPEYADNGSEILELHGEKKYQPFTGGYNASEGNVKLVGNETVIYIKQYYGYEGREYMIGTAWFSEEDFGVFLMTRGQN